MNETAIIERLAGLEVKVDLCLQLLQEHRSAHTQYNLLCAGALLSAVGALIAALVV
jgi:hypothetical protein